MMINRNSTHFQIHGAWRRARTGTVAFPSALDVAVGFIGRPPRLYLSGALLHYYKNIPGFSNPGNYFRLPPKAAAPPRIKSSRMKTFWELSIE